MGYKFQSSIECVLGGGNTGWVMVLPAGHQFITSAGGLLLHGVSVAAAATQTTANRPRPSFFLPSSSMTETTSAHPAAGSHNSSSTTQSLSGGSGASTIIPSSQWEQTMISQDFTKAQMNEIVLDYLIKG